MLQELKDTSDRDSSPLYPSNPFDNLPNELLQVIVDLAYEDSPVPADPICRSLFPFQRQALFRSIKITSGRMLSQLAHSIISVNPALASLVQSLTVGIFGQIPSFGSACSLDQLLVRLSNLQSLVLARSRRSYVELVTYLERLGSATLPRLEFLEFCTRSSWTSPLCLGHYGFLTSFPTLRRLVIHYNNAGSGSPVGVGGGTNHSVAVSNSINFLTIIGPARGHHHVADLCRVLPRLRRLDLRGMPAFDSGGNYKNLLQRLPTSLLALSLLGGPRGLNLLRPQRNNDCSQYLPRFARLQHLVIGRDVIKIEGLENVLRQLPRLETVTFGGGTAIGLDQARIIFTRVQQKVPGFRKIKLLGGRGWEVS